MTAASNLVRFPVASPVVDPASSERRRPLDVEAVVLEAPVWLSPMGRRTFVRMVAWLREEAPDWLATIDEAALGLAVEHLAVAVSASKAMRGRGGAYKPLAVDTDHGGAPRKNPAAQVFRDSTSAYLAVVRELGLTPRARRALDVAGGLGSGPESDDPAGLFPDA